MYAIDRIEEKYIIAENLKTKEKKTIPIDSFPIVPKEGLIFSIENDIIIENKSMEEKRRKLLREKMNRLKKHDEK